MIGNDFVLTPRLPAAQPSAKLLMEKVDDVPVIPVEAISTQDFIPVSIASQAAASRLELLVELLHRQSFIVFALLFLLVGASGVEVGGRYWSARLIKPVSSVLPAKHAISGLNLAIPASQLQSKLKQITGQPVSLTVGNQTLSVSSDTIKSWLKITPSSDKSQDYVHVNSQAMQKSLTGLANQFVAAPVNQVTVNHGGLNQVVIAGHDGASLSNPATITQQVQSLTKTVMDGKGLQFSTPLSTQSFQAVTPAAFNKLIEVDVDTHQMYLYDNGNLARSYAISAGAPITPTPIGEFHIWEKLTEQTMTGRNPNGTKYIQPNVRWINYFDHSGDAVHGNYWRPLSVFGAVNTSHGCVSLPDSEAEWVYDWAPVGTTVITHH